MRLNIDAQISKELFERMVEVARRLREDSTPTEATLWEALRNRRLAGLKFRRQQPIGPFVADFYCHQEKLVIEVDGPIHQFQKTADRQRDELLEAAGFRVLRIPSEHVETSLPSVLERIRGAVAAAPLPGERGERRSG